jgi:hypothetical protein
LVCLSNQMTHSVVMKDSGLCLRHFLYSLTCSIVSIRGCLGVSVADLDQLI